ncbi:hypothetical protein [Kordia sp.]|uniref:EF-Tu C-terminal domain-related protein n=1 Tax=Kordia sp. TaxID=1965332 RepID=UPI003B59D99F
METQVIAPDIIAKVTYKTTEEGGRKTAVHSGYRPQIKFPFSEQTTSGIQDFIAKKIVYPGEMVVTEIYMLSPHLFEQQLAAKMEFKLLEGDHVVAIGVVLKIVNDTLRK